MDLNTIAEIARPDRNGEGIDWRDGDAFLAGGTWLFSEPQPHLRRLIDLHGLGWTPLTVSEQGLEIAATCEIAKLAALSTPPEWKLRRSSVNAAARSFHPSKSGTPPPWAEISACRCRRAR